jgi:CheY-like chemotaxis protein
MGENLTILIAEDDSNDVVILKKALERAGIKYPIHVVPDGQEAVEYLRGAGQYSDRTKFPFPNVVFLDLKMPRMTGFDVLEWSKNNPQCAVIPVIILTASKQEEDIKKAYEMGANAYLVKPSQIGDLQNMVKTSFDFWACCEKPHVSGKC